MVLLITDGKQTQISNPTERNPFQVSTTIKNRGIEINALGIGSADPTELWDFASRADEVIFVPDFDSLDASVQETSELLCPSKLLSVCFIDVRYMC